jgi:hypothetical protein
MEEVKTCVQEIIKNPFPPVPWSDFALGDFTGWRRAKFQPPLPTRLRIFYVVCHECRSRGDRVYNLCTDCETTPDGYKMVIFTGIRDRDKAYDRK